MVVAEVTGLGRTSGPMRELQISFSLSRFFFEQGYESRKQVHKLSDWIYHIFFEIRKLSYHLEIFTVIPGGLYWNKFRLYLIFVCFFCLNSDCVRQSDSYQKVIIDCWWFFSLLSCDCMHLGVPICY